MAPLTAPEVSRCPPLRRVLQFPCVEPSKQASNPGTLPAHRLNASGETSPPATA